MIVGNTRWEASLPYIFAGKDWKPAARVATTTDIILSGLQTIDDVSLVSGDIVLVKNQATSTQNGLYTASSSTWNRHVGADENSEILPGLSTFVQEGTTNAGSIWVIENTGTVTIGTTSLLFRRVSEKNGFQTLKGVNPTYDYATYQDASGYFNISRYLKNTSTWSANLMTVNSTGDLVAAGNVSAYSDLRLKKDLSKIEDAINKVKSLTGYTFTRIDSGDRQTGLIAQDVEKVVPEAVLHGSEYLSVSYGNLVGLLVEAIKELESRVDKLEKGV